MLLVCLQAASQRFDVFTGLSVTKMDTYEYEGMNPEYYTGLHRPYYADTAMSEHVAGELRLLCSLTCLPRLEGSYGLGT